MSKAYAAQTGVPLCITDSYRSLPDQISIKAKRGRFAATPGTSRHGLGRAVDLCGGVQDFGSPAHRWMRQNAPLYGWFHPSWAAAGRVAARAVALRVRRLTRPGRERRPSTATYGAERTRVERFGA